MVRATISREATAHTEATISLGAPTANISTEPTGRVTATLELEGQGVQ